MRRVGLRPPWMNTNINVPPVAGEILVFPSWLVHYVEPYECEAEDPIRIVISFNATVI